MDTIVRKMPEELASSRRGYKGKLSKEEYRKLLIKNFRESDHADFNIDKVSVSKGDPVITTVNKVLTYIK